MSSDSIDEIKYEVGVTKKPITKEEAASLGAGVFNMRLHVFVDSRDRAKVFLNFLPGTPNTLSVDIMVFHSLESFPVVSFPMRNRDGKETKAELFPPADPGQKYGLYTLGLINTLSVRVPSEGPPINVNPSQLVRCTRYVYQIYRLYLRTSHGILSSILPQPVLFTLIENTPIKA